MKVYSLLSARKELTEPPLCSLVEAHAECTGTRGKVGNKNSTVMMQCIKTRAGPGSRKVGRLASR